MRRAEKRDAYSTKQAQLGPFYQFAHSEIIQSHTKSGAFIHKSRGARPKNFSMKKIPKIVLNT